VFASQSLVERVLRRRGPRFAAGTDDVALRGGEGFVAKEVLELLHADIGVRVGEVGGEGMSQAVHQGARVGGDTGPSAQA